MGLNDMGWDNVIVYKIQDMESESNVQKFMDTATKVKEYVEANPQLVNLTIHVWLSLSFIMNPNPPHVVLTDANFHTLVRGSIQELEDVCPRPVFVAVCPDSRFNNVEGRTDEIAKRLAAELREWGILCSTSENMKAPEGSAGKNAIWSAIEKCLFRQRVFLMCASDRDAVDRLNQVAHRPQYSGINLFRLKTITSPPTLFHTSEEKQDALNREEEYWRSVGEEGDVGVNATRFIKKARKSRKPKLFDAETANFDLEERPAANAYWLPVNQFREKDILCVKCKYAETFEERGR
eukprot:s3216_g1.t1